MDFIEDSETWDFQIPISVFEMQQKVVDGLKPKHQAKIEQLRVALKDVIEPRHNDFFLYKWLKGRKYDVALTEKMIRENLKWREEMQMDCINKVFQPSEVIRKYLPFGLSGQDKEGHPLLIFTMGRMDTRGIVYSAKMADIIKYYTTCFEYMEKLTNIQSQKLGKLIDKFTVIADYEYFKIQDYLWKPSFELSTSILKTFDANYPEILHKVFFINAPKVFSVFWVMVKPFLSEGNRNKIKIYGKDWKETLLENIDADQLPVHWGGTQIDEVDGNPYCSSKIVLGGPIPTSYYLGFSRRDSMDNLDLETATLEPKKSFSLDFEVNIPGSTLNWTFGTDEHDVAFGVSYKPQNGGEDIEILPVVRCECQFVPEEGTLLCEQVGTYVVLFDNSYSWYKSKKVYYDIKLTPPTANQDIEK